MQRIEYKTIDKSLWGDGPWQNEPDKVQWQDEATGLPCLIVRNPRFGNWCGYVGINQAHPFFAKNYDDADTLNMSVHGGLTFGGFCHPGDEATSICHKPDPGEPDHVYWLGFDCAHGWDLSPGYRHLLLDELHARKDETYRDINYVMNECKSLAQQLINYK